MNDVREAPQNILWCGTSAEEFYELECQNCGNADFEEAESREAVHKSKTQNS
jgi:predicted nucleic-acid-binding Zn-ribbon protein